MRKHVVHVICGAFVSVFAACAAPEAAPDNNADENAAEQNGGESSGPTTDQGAVYEETAVTTHADGSVSMRHRLVTKAQQIRERELDEQARDAAAKGIKLEQMQIAQDSFCASTSLSMWDQPNYVGNRICFSGTGTTDLALYTRGSCVCSGTICPKWYGKSYSGCSGSLGSSNFVRSLKAGNSAGGFGVTSSGWCTLDATDWFADQWISSLTPASGERWLTRNTGPGVCN